MTISSVASLIPERRETRPAVRYEVKPLISKRD